MLCDKLASGSLSVVLSTFSLVCGALLVVAVVFVSLDLGFEIENCSGRLLPTVAASKRGLQTSE